MKRLSPDLRKRICCLLLALVTFAVFWPVRQNGFIEYDDDDYITENPVVKAGWTLHGVAWAFMGFHAINWHPLTWLSHMTDCQFFGLNAGEHHLVSVFIHCCSAVILLCLLDLLTGKFWRSAFVAALFALFPLRVESVAWAAERKDVLCAFFFLLTLLTYVRHVRAQKPDAPSWTGMELRLSLLFFALALLSKPMAVTLPVILLLLDFWPLQRISDFKAQMPLLIREKWPFFFLTACFCVITVFAQHEGLPSASPWARLAGMVMDYWVYVQKMVWPENLSIVYERPAHISAESLIKALLALVVIWVLAVINWRRRPWLLVGWLWFLVMLLPVTAVTLGGLSVANRYTYLPQIGFLIMLVWGIVETAPAFFNSLAGKITIAITAVVVLCLCAWQTHQEIGYWRNTQTIMERAVKLDPDNGIAAQVLRIYLFEQTHPGVREGGHTTTQTLP